MAVEEIKTWKWDKFPSFNGGKRCRESSSFTTTFWGAMRWCRCRRLHALALGYFQRSPTIIINSRGKDYWEKWSTELSKKHKLFRMKLLDAMKLLLRSSSEMFLCARLCIMHYIALISLPFIFCSLLKELGGTMHKAIVIYYVVNNHVDSGCIHEWCPHAGWTFTISEKGINRDRHNLQFFLNLIILQRLHFHFIWWRKFTSIYLIRKTPRSHNSSVTRLVGTLAKKTSIMLSKLLAFAPLNAVLNKLYLTHKFMLNVMLDRAKWKCILNNDFSSVHCFDLCKTKG